MSKVVVIVSFDTPKTDEGYKKAIDEALGIFNHSFANVKNHHTWIGVNAKADAVLKAIGVSDG